MMHTVNKFACEPFVENAVKVEKHGDGAFGAVKIGNSKTTLVRLKVLFDARFMMGTSVQYIPCDTHVWVRADLYASAYGKEVFSGPEGVKFILLPADRIEAFENNLV